MADLREAAEAFVFRDYRTSKAESDRLEAALAQALAAEPTESLDAAWAAAEAALPEGWAITILSAFDGSSFMASAMSHRSSLRLTEGLADDEGAVVVEGDGPTPAAALNALSQALRSEQDK